MRSFLDTVLDIFWCYAYWKSHHKNAHPSEFAPGSTARGGEYSLIVLHVVKTIFVVFFFSKCL
jgi:hypothetical protein